MASETKILESIVVSFSAPAISVMLYDNCRSDNQTGFLLGDIFRTESVVHERNREGVKLEYKKFKFHIHIRATIACPEINLYKIGYKPENIPKIDNIVGWFTSRELISTNPIDPLKLTFTEKLIHKNLRDLEPFITLPYFTGCVLDTYVNSSRNAHSCDFKFFQLNQDNRFQEVECAHPIPEFKSFQQTFIPLGKRRDFIKSHKNDLLTTNKLNEKFIDKSIAKLAVAELNMFNLLQNINDILEDIELLRERNKTLIKQEKTEIQQKSKNKPSWITQLEQKHVYQHSKMASI